MKITTTDKDLTEKLNAQILKNVEKQLSTQDLNDEEKAANLVLAKRAAQKDAEAITNLVVQALA
jgi:chaperonin GroEL (HSP60 family)